jgi:predicted dehydrogenase
MREALVVGFGSIGRRHSAVLKKMGLSVSIVSRREAVVHPPATFKSLDEALRAASYDYVVIATETAAHLADLQKLALAGYNGKVLVEKPLFPQRAVLPDSSGMGIYVGYQLRFHPAVCALRELISEDDCITASLYVGQHLDLWRADRDSQQTYSSRSALGGGVLRDLSHELDLAGWLFGSCDRITALGGRLSELTVDSDDVWGILGEFDRCPIVTLQLNYLDRIGQRTITVITRTQTIHVDLVAGTLDRNGTIMDFKATQDEPIEAMHRAIISDRGQKPCSGEIGLQVVNMIEAIERAAQSKVWVAL